VAFISGMVAPALLGATLFAYLLGRRLHLHVLK
jgi:hypothetical protein